MTDDKKNRNEMSRTAGARPSEEKVEQLLQKLHPVELPSFHTERLQARVRAASAGSTWADRLRSPQLAWAVAGACVVALVLIVVNIDRGGPVPLPVAPGVSVAQGNIEPVTPADNSVIGANDVEIVAAIYPPVEQGIVRLYVDEVDVTGLAEVTGSYVMYSPAGKFEEGEHIITIEIQDGSGRKLRDVSWLFYALNGERPSLDEQV
ncbi:MAG: hypothetical protein U9Q95_02865 [Candidatus Eisenbacteria bacterium]|nr:hypothetical protein [Candidatus Eisenbacteria bacterium]